MIDDCRAVSIGVSFRLFFLLHPLLGSEDALRFPALAMILGALPARRRGHQLAVVVTLHAYYL